MTAQAANKIPSSLAETFYTEYGEQILYVPVAKRIGIFLEAYPPEKFSILSDVNIIQGRLVVETRLTRLDDEKTIANAHSSGIPGSVEHKELERLETASLQRLMARLGFGGDVFDADESLDFKITNLSRAPKAPAVKIEDEGEEVSYPAIKAVNLSPEAVQNPEEMPTKATPVATDDQPITIGESDEVKTTSEASPSVDEDQHDSPALIGDLVDEAKCDGADKTQVQSAKQPRQPSRPTAPKGMSEDAKTQAKLNNLRKQINQQALRKGITPPEFNTIEEAAAILRNIVNGV
ncbi:MAG: hypothetical protein PHT38_00240 [Halothiobacillus sp.]|jgi:hypothetical protein|nr:hypothetical protein [Halothiobacillus sp.]MDY0146538.1 hypothetical protein [Halothiobacillus sp.]